MKDEWQTFGDVLFSKARVSPAVSSKPEQVAK